MTQHDWMQTFTGQAFDPMHPDPKKICIEDIAHALSLNCRYAGHVREFYSVAEHSIHISWAVHPRVALWGLLHDATEAYVADLVRPVKHRLPEYRAMEDNLMWAICKKFNLPVVTPAEVKDADLRIVVNEKEALMTQEPEPWGAIQGIEPLDNTLIGPWTPWAAESRFLERFHQLYSAWS